MTHSSWEKFNIDKEPKFIYKYLTIDKFIDIILNNRLWVSRSDKFKDPFEAISNQELYYHHFIKLEELVPSTNPMLDLDKIKKEHSNNKSHLKKIIVEKQKKIYATPFYSSDEPYENMAMWNIYSSQTGVLLRIEYDSFLNSTLSNIAPSTFTNYKKFYGMIKYVPIQNFDPFLEEDLYRVPNVGFKKDISYQHEKEFRLLFSIGDNEDTENKVGFYHMIDFNKFNAIVVANPFVENYFFENIKSIIKGINSNIEIKHSNLRMFV